MPAVQERKPVLLAETSDVRPFARLLRGIGFSSRAYFALNDDGIRVQVDEGRTMSATSYIPAQIFDKYELYHPPRKNLGQGRLLNFEDNDADGPDAARRGKTGEKRDRRRSTDARRARTDNGVWEQGDSNASGISNQEHAADDEDENEEEEEEEEAEPILDFELNLHNLLSCLNIYGNATTTTVSSRSIGTGGQGQPYGANAGGNGGGGDREDEIAGTANGRRFGRGRNWAGGGIADDREDGEGDVGNLGGNQTGGKGKSGKEAIVSTGCLMSWKGRGYPLTLVLKDQDPASPTTVCKIDLLEPEQMLEDDFDDEAKQFHIIMRSTWLREALSDLDPSCAKLTIKGGPKIDEDDENGSDADRNQSGPSTPVAGNANARTHLAVKRRKRTGDDAFGGDDPDDIEGRRDDNAYDVGAMPRKQKRQMRGTFKVEAVGNSGTTELDYPNETEIMDAFLCEEEFKESYAFSTFMLCQKALQASSKVSVRIDYVGFCSLQMMMPPTIIGGTKLDFTGIVEFKFKPLEVEEEQ